MTIDDAMNTVSWARMDADSIDPKELVAAATALAVRVRELERELERERARGIDRHERQQTHRIEGHELIERTEVGGPRHFLSGTAVHAGTGLYLLTHIGWHPGRYEWNFRAGSPPRFFFALPGVDLEVSAAIPPAARLAWPTEIER